VFINGSSKNSKGWQGPAKVGKHRQSGSNGTAKAGKEAVKVENCRQRSGKGRIEGDWNWKMTEIAILLSAKNRQLVGKRSVKG